MWRLRPDFDPAQAMTATFTDDDAYAMTIPTALIQMRIPIRGLGKAFTRSIHPLVRRLPPGRSLSMLGR